MTINPHKGDISFEVNGKQYVLRYTHRSLVLLEDQLGRGLLKIMAEIHSWGTHPEDIRLGTVCAMLWAGLQKHHPDMTLDEATELLDDLDGGLSRAIELLSEGLGRAFSAPGTKGTNPPKKENGAGTTSSLSTSASAIIPTTSGRLPLES